MYCRWIIFFVWLEFSETYANKYLIEFSRISISESSETYRGWGLINYWDFTDVYCTWNVRVNDLCNYFSLQSMSHIVNRFWPCPRGRHAEPPTIQKWPNFLFIQKYVQCYKMYTKTIFRFFDILSFNQSFIFIFWDLRDFCEPDSETLTSEW